MSYFVLFLSIMLAFGLITRVEWWLNVKITVIKQCDIKYSKLKPLHKIYWCFWMWDINDKRLYDISKGK